MSACWSCLLPRLLELTASSRGFNISSNSCCCAIMKSNSWSSLKSRINKRQKNLQWIIFYKSTDVKQVHHWGGHHCKEAFFFIGGWGGCRYHTSVYNQNHDHVSVLLTLFGCCHCCIQKKSTFDKGDNHY